MWDLRRGYEVDSCGVFGRGRYRRLQYHPSRQARCLVAVFAGIATVVAAFLFFGSGKASRLHQTASPELYGQPRTS
jgi:hypothetical protein